ncbi:MULTISPECIES: GerAB/ArcD/ProY family transporter [Bacillaceae]|uniref:GerAB/ArcD/ProY family transporter n=1 Tax=Evansella alkalicola TaxID=745819 RepID=A0ABS6JS89_9BACI|nr:MULTISPECIES: GerAB/ArcD/ProY family transporter [Bacillaceae]MBU9721433.1 GerAB/ArcD/ProY family transporter [Bacillus alkalicola]
MNIQNKYSQLGSVELFTFTYCSAVTIGFMFLPYISQEEIRSAYFKVMAAVIPYLLLIFLWKKVVDKHQERDMFSLLKKNSKSWIYYPVILYFIGSCLYSLLFIVKSLIIIVQTYMMQDTEQWIIGIAFLITVGASALYGIHAISRMIVVIYFHEILLVITLIGFLFSEDFRWVNIPPYLGVDVLTFMKSSLSEVTRYGGIVTVFAFLPLVKKDVKVFKPIIISLLSIMATYVLICITTLGVFGYDQALTLLSPVTALMQTTTSPTGLFERLDLFFLTVWVMSFFKIGLIFIWFTATLCKQIVPVKPKREWIYITLVSSIIVILMLITPSITSFDWRPYNLNMLSVSLMVPFLILLYLKFRKKKGVGET